LEKTKELKLIPGVEGILLVGSVAKGTTHEGSDVDLFVVGAFQWRRTTEAVDGVSVDVSYFPTGFFAGAFTDPVTIQKGNKLDWLRHSVILHDPNGILRELKKRALSESWNPRDIAAAVEKARQSLAAYRSLPRSDPRLLLHALRGTYEASAVIVAMRAGNLLFFPPIYLLDAVEGTPFKEAYIRINGIETATHEDADRLILLAGTRIDSLLTSYPDHEALRKMTSGYSSGMVTELRHAQGCLRKEKPREALLEARMAYSLYAGVRLWESAGRSWIWEEEARREVGGSASPRAVEYAALHNLGGELFKEFLKAMGLDYAPSHSELEDLEEACSRILEG
jgi:hypothetical protein